MFQLILRVTALLAASALLIGFVLDVPRLSPPDPVVIETGPVGGSYHGNALRYAQHLTAAGFKVEVRPNPQSLDSIGHVNGDGPKTHIAFTAQAIDGRFAALCAELRAAVGAVLAANTAARAQRSGEDTRLRAQLAFVVR